jgi:hypothetical protein
MKLPLIKKYCFSFHKTNSKFLLLQKKKRMKKEIDKCEHLLRSIYDANCKAEAFSDSSHSVKEVEKFKKSY